MTDKERKFLSNIQSDSADVRFAAWRAAGEMSAEVIPPLGKTAASDNPGIAKAAREALTTLAHSVGREAGTPGRAPVVRQFLALAGPAYAHAVRVHAFRQLSLIAGEQDVASIAKQISDPALREEVVFCLERIPGEAPLKALMAAYGPAKDDFKPRILAALGHRRAEEAAGLCAEAMRSAKPEIAMAGIKAFGRIGKKPAGALQYPETAALSEGQKIGRMDSLLRYADAQTQQGNSSEAMKIYRAALERPEPHWQCAAIVGIAKIGTPEAAAAIFPKLKSADRTVRITAGKAWKGMATEETKA